MGGSGSRARCPAGTGGLRRTGRVARARAGGPSTAPSPNSSGAERTGCVGHRDAGPAELGVHRLDVRMAEAGKKVSRAPPGRTGGPLRAEGGVRVAEVLHHLRFEQMVSLLADQPGGPPVTGDRLVVVTLAIPCVGDA